MKGRLSASIDEHVLAAAEEAVRQGHAPSMSALVEDALRRQVAHAKRLEATDELLDALDAEFGAIEPGEAERLVREMRSKAIIVRPNGGHGRSEAA